MVPFRGRQGWGVTAEMHAPEFFLPRRLCRNAPILYLCHPELAVRDLAFSAPSEEQISLLRLEMTIATQSGETGKK